MKKALFFQLFISFFLISEAQDIPTTCKNSTFLLSKSVEKYDPGHNWKEALLSLHIQEPRVPNPLRYSVIKMDNASQSFELQRNRDDHVATYIVDASGEATVLLDGSSNFPKELIEKYRLDPQASFGYRRFYSFLYGLPMSLDAAVTETISPADITEFNNREAFVIPFELKEPLISKNWKIFLATDDFAVLGLETYHPNEPDKKGERLVFEGKIELSKFAIPRIHHWYDIATVEYLGSDIVVKSMVNE